MSSKFTKIVNLEQALKSSAESISAVQQSPLQTAGDYEMATFTLEPGQAQHPHFHTYGDIDLFVVLEGEGELHLAQIESDSIVGGSEEVIRLVKGDTYSLAPYILHSVRTQAAPIKILNIAPGAHSAPKSPERTQRSVDVYFPRA